MLNWTCPGCHIFGKAVRRPVMIGDRGRLPEGTIHQAGFRCARRTTVPRIHDKAVAEPRQITEMRRQSPILLSHAHCLARSDTPRPQRDGTGTNRRTESQPCRKAGTPDPEPGQLPKSEGDQVAAASDPNASRPAVNIQG